MTLEEHIKHAEEVAENNRIKAKKWEEAKPSYHGDERVCEKEKNHCLGCANDHMELAGLLHELKLWRAMSTFLFGCNVQGETFIPLEEAKMAACKALCHPGVRCPDNYCVEIRREFDKIKGVKIADHFKSQLYSASNQKKKCMFEPIQGRYPECDGNCDPCSYFI